ncbi:mechanosensitive ion channel family protein [Kaistella sp. BT6-1-3]|uniref:Mechanosensitive ion channel family protein n=1 Tax=Kaistella yananensis TaxID=2989820 RepID=A0ABT3JIT4_9FLAO|nr:mechanosensitive ion channel family protein [Kaistella yananensis]MCW4450682.1 mechanosensitive ion channel family protein [Kaistella yananensis]
MEEVTQLKYVDIVYNVLERWYLKFAQVTPNIVVGLIVFTLILLMSSYLSKLAVKVFHRFFPKSKNNSIVTLIGIFKFLIILMAAFIAFEIMGLGGFVLKFLGSLGVAGVIAGVALKDLVSSMFSGILIGIDKAFAVGDYVSIKGISGAVESIGFLTTKVITDEGKKVYIPNQLIFSAPFINYSASSHRKVFIDLEIPNNEDLEKAKKVIVDEIHTFDFAENKDNAEVIFLKQSLGIFYLEARFQMKTGEKIAHVRSEALLRIKKKLDDNGIQLATQTQIETGNSVQE